MCEHPCTCCCRKGLGLTKFASQVLQHHGSGVWEIIFSLGLSLNLIMWECKHRKEISIILPTFLGVILCALRSIYVFIIACGVSPRATTNYTQKCGKYDAGFPSACHGGPPWSVRALTHIDARISAHCDSNVSIILPTFLGVVGGIHPFTLKHTPTPDTKMCTSQHL